jgi:predicted nucleic acid-binding protein
MYLLDTDTLTHLHGGNSNVVERLKSIVDTEVAITIITKVEILRGRLDYFAHIPHFIKNRLPHDFNRAKSTYAD